MSTELIEQQNEAGVMTLMRAAVEKNIDPASMVTLYDLHERIREQRAKEDFRNAMTKFQSECPSIGKDKDGYQGAYRYATLEHIADTIRTPLAECGLSYTFNAIQTAEEVRVTCTVHHLSGHSETAEFASVACGTKMMNATQMRASALSYGRRYALTMALGLVIREEDDDGRSSSPPDAPDAADGPITQPRGKRITKEQIESLFSTWQRQMKANELDCTNPAWVKIVTRVTTIPESRVFSLEAWSTDDLAIVAKEIGVGDA